MRTKPHLTISRRELFAGGFLSGLLLTFAFVISRLIDRPISGQYKELTEGEADIYSSIAEAAFPGDGHAPAADKQSCSKYFDIYLQRVGRPHSMTLILGLYAMEYGSVLFGHFGLLSNAPLERRIEILEKWRTGPLFARGITSGMKTVVSMAYWAQLESLSANGVYMKCPNWAGTLHDQVES